jgi:glycosyltransferase involved in cell wall biosynthesis
LKVLVNALSARRGGIVTYTQNLARSFADLPLDATIVGPPELAQGQKTIVTRDVGEFSPLKRILWEQTAWRQYVKSFHPDILFSSANFALYHCPVPQLLLMREGGLFNPFYLRNVFPFLGNRIKIQTRLRRNFMFRSMRAASTIMFPSETLRNWVASWVPDIADRFVVNSYGIDHSHFETQQEIIAPKRDAVKLLYVSVYYPHKDPSTLSDAVLQLHQRGIDAHARITMAASEFHPWPSGVSDLAKLQSAESNGQAELGSIVYKDLPGVYHNADIFVFPSISETFGFPLVEAMAAKLPVIAADTLINQEICGPTALYYNPSDAASLANRVEELLNRPDLYRWMAENGEKRVKERFSWQGHASRLISILENTAGAASKN